MLGHFPFGQPLAALPDPAVSFQRVSFLKRWHLCQYLVRHFGSIGLWSTCPLYERYTNGNIQQKSYLLMMWCCLLKK